MGGAVRGLFFLTQTRELGREAAWPAFWNNWRDRTTDPEEEQLFFAGNRQSTWNNYRSSLRQFVCWQKWAQKVCTPPLVEQNLVDFLLYRAMYQPRGGVQSETISGDLSALRKWHALHHYPWAKRTDRVRQVLAGIAFKYGKGKKTDAALEVPPVVQPD
jgi:hypothetical protein